MRLLHFLSTSHNSFPCVNTSYDLMKACKEIGEGTRHVPELLGELKIEPVTTVDAYDKKLESKRVQNDELSDLLRRYTSRKAFSS